VNQIFDGARVSYIGMTGQEQPAVGDRGKVLSSTASYSHVQWHTGARAGQIDMVDNADLVDVEPQGDPLDDALDAPPSRFAVHELLDMGPAAVLSALSEAGALAPLASAAEEASERLASRLGSDPTLGRFLAGTDSEARQRVLDIVTPYLLRQASGG
jgi:hypothetical protein